jgi:hypothetical protein
LVGVGYAGLYLGFRDNPTRIGCQQEGMKKTSTVATLTWNEPAQLHIRVASAVPNCSNRHKFATGCVRSADLSRDVCALLPAKPLKRPAANQLAAACQRVGQGLALFDYLRRTPN